MAHDRRQRLGLGTYKQLLQVVSCRRTRIQPQRPNQAPEEPPPRSEIRERIEIHASLLSNSSLLADRRFSPYFFTSSLPYLILPSCSPSHANLRLNKRDTT